MLSLAGRSSRFCDGITRRHFFQIGALGLGGLTLADLLRAEALAAPAVRSQKAIINIHLPGGPPHQDMFDLKPSAPTEIRGEFRPIATNVPGIEICELFPRLAGMADRYAIVRSLIGSTGQHDSYQTASGWSELSLQSAGGHPSLGSVASKLIGSRDGKAPPYVDFNTNGRPGFLGPVYAAYKPDGLGRANLRLHGSISPERLHDRVELLRSVDRMRETVDQSGMMAAADSFNQRAIDLLTSSKIADALDVSKEKADLVKRYHGEPGGDARSQNCGKQSEQFLMARRLIQAGVRCVSMHWGGWDTHTSNFRVLRSNLPRLDIGLSALIEDLTAHDLFDDVMVVVWGEFGRTPRINSNDGGRDHWPQVSPALLFGGGLKGGQVIGATDRLGGTATDRPVHFHELFATFYHQLGLNPETTQLKDLNGRPQYLVDYRQPVAELL